MRCINENPPIIHHYIQESEVARNWACVGSNKDPFYDAWEQSLNAFLHFKNYEPYEPEPNIRELGDFYMADYQVVVVNSFENFSKRDLITKTSFKTTDNFLLSINYSYPVFYSNESRPHIRKDFFIDIASFHTLGHFLENLERNDIALMSKKILHKLSFPTK
jgi:hypothetical protein